MLVSLHHSGTMFCGAMKALLSFTAQNKFFFVRLPKQYLKKVAPVCQRISHSGGSVIFWGCVTFTGLGDLLHVDGTIKQRKHLDVLNNHAFPSGDKLIGESFILQQDNAPCHKAKLITQFLKDVCVNTLN